MRSGYLIYLFLEDDLMRLFGGETTKSNER